MADYTAASNGRRLRMFAASRSGPNTATANVETIRARSRSMVRNDTWSAALLSKSASNGIGCGIQAKTVNGTPEHVTLVQSLWDAFTKYSDADWAVDWYGQQNTAWREWEEAGEVFIRFRSRRESDGLPIPLQVQLIEAEQCPSHYYGRASNGNRIRRGIEFSAIGKRVAYWMYREHPGDQHHDVVNGSELVRVPAEQVRHLFIPLRAGQIRGVPNAAASMVKSFNLEKIFDNSIERSATNNLFSVFFTRKAGAPDDPLTGSMAAEVAPETGADGIQFGGLEPGTGFELPEGYDVKFSDPPGVDPALAEVLRMHLLSICAAHGVPYEVATGDLRNISDRALRLILNEFRRLIEQKQWLYMIPLVCQPVREAFFDACVLAGKLVLPDYAERREWYVKTLHVPQGWPWSHPVQDVNASKIALRAGLTSRTDVILSAGEDPERVDAQIAADNARADALGFTFDSDPRKTASSGSVQKDAPADE